MPDWKEKNKQVMPKPKSEVSASGKDDGKCQNDKKEEVPEEIEARIIVCGGRHFSDPERLETVMNILLEEYKLRSDHVEIVSGHCEGADRLGELWARNHSSKCTLFPAKWSKFGRAAGPIRNTEMVEYAENAHISIVVAFVNERTRGTWDTVRKAEKKGIRVVVDHY